MASMLYDAQSELASEHSLTGSAVAPALEDGTLDKEHFEQWVLKIDPCSIKSAHDWSSCPYLHDGETKARRRCPRKYAYTSIACPSMKEEGFCPLGDTCPFAHNDFEYWLHHTRYHTCLCKKGERCDRKFCFFAHTSCELRTPLERPKLPPGATAAAAVLRRPKKERLACGGGGPDSPAAAARQAPRQPPSGLLTAAAAVVTASGGSCAEVATGSPTSSPALWDSGGGSQEGSRNHHCLQGLSASLQTVTLGEEQQQQQGEGKTLGGGGSRQPGDALVSPFEAERQQAFSALSRPCSAALPGGLSEGTASGLGAAHRQTTAPAAGYDNGGNPTTPTAAAALGQVEGHNQFVDVQGSQSTGRGLNVDDVSRALMMEVARELSEGLIDAATATSLLGRLLPAQALAQLSAELQVQAHTRAQLAPARGHGYQQQQPHHHHHHHQQYQQQHHHHQHHHHEQQQQFDEMDSEAFGAAAAALGSPGTPWLGHEQQQEQQQLSRLQLGPACRGGPVACPWELGIAAEGGVVALGGWTSLHGYSVPAPVNVQPAWGSLVLPPSTPTGHAMSLMPPSSPLGFVARPSHGLPAVSAVLGGSGIMPAGVGSHQGPQY